MTLNEHLDDIRDDLRREIFTNEASISQFIVLRLLHTLGWPYNPQVIIPEYLMEGRKVDFALCHPPLNPLVCIEVKQIGQIGRAERRLFEYLFRRRVPIAILTDGREWHFFQPSGQGDYKEHRVYKLDLIGTDNQESSERLNRYLNYKLIRTGEAIRAFEDDYRDITKQRDIETSVPKAWIKLVEEGDEFLIDVVAEKTESLCGYKPTDEQVLDFLQSLKREKSPEEAHSPISPVLRHSAPKGFDVVQDYLIPVIRLMREGKSHTETFHLVAEKLGVTYSAVSAQCRRTLGLDTQEFVEHVENGQIIQIMKNKYPRQIVLIENELEKS